MKKILVIFTFLLAVILASCTTNETDIVKKISLNSTEQTIEIGKTFQFTAVLENLEGDVTWSVDNAEVASISNKGLVTALKAGSTNINAELEGIKVSAKITVPNLAVPVLIVSQNEVEILVDYTEGLQVNASVEVSGKVVEANLVWSVENSQVATVSNGLIKPVSVGETLVTVTTTVNDVELAKTIRVVIKIDASITVNTQNVKLNVVKVGEVGVTEFIVSAQTMVSGQTTQQNVTFTTTDSNIKIEKIDNTVKITALSLGLATVKASFTYQGVEVYTLINVNVEKIEVLTSKLFVIDNSNIETNTLDIQSLNPIGNIEGVYANNTKIAGTDGIVNADWVSKQALGVEIEVMVVTESVIYNALLKVVTNYQDILFSSVENGEGSKYELFSGSKEEVGFDQADEVYEFYTGTNAGGWAARLAPNHNLRGFDWLIFDFSFDQPFQGNFVMWLGTSHVLLLDTLGQIHILQAGPNFDPQVDSKDYIKFYQDGQVVSSGLKPRVKYTIEINLKHNAGTSDDWFSLDKSMTAYFANAFAVTQSYYDEHLSQKAEPSVLNVDFGLTNDKNSGSSYQLYNGNLNQLGFKEDAKVYHLDSKADHWSDRLQITNSNLKGYEYMVFELMLLQEQTNNMFFWMDLTVGDKFVTFITPTGNISSNRIKVYHNSELVTGALEVNKLYMFVIELGHEDPESRYAFGLAGANLLIGDSRFVKADALDDQFNTTPVVPNVVKLDFDLTGDKVASSSFDLVTDVVSIGFKEGSKVHHLQSVGDAWSDRIQITNGTVKDYEYLLFDLVLNKALETPMTFWMDLTVGNKYVTWLNADGSLSTNLVTILHNGQPVVGALEINKLYTFVIELGHEDPENRYAIGLAGADLYIGNSRFVKSSALQSELPKVEEPIGETVKQLDFSLTSEKIAASSFDLVTDVVALGFKEGSKVYHLQSVGDTWSDRLQITTDEVKDFEYLVFELMFNTVQSDTMIFWMDLTVGNKYVSTISAAGVISSSRITVLYNGLPVIGALETNKIYTFVVELGHEDPENRYAFGLGGADLYVANSRFVKIEALESELPKAEKVSVGVTFDLTADKVASTYQLYSGDVTQLGFKENQTVFEYNALDGNSWSNRLQITGAAYANFEKLVFELVITQALSIDINFWMDMLNLVSLRPDGSSSAARLVVYNANNEVVTSALQVNTVYRVEIDLVHADAEFRYAFGLNDSTTVYIADTRLI